jgi:type IV pilus biogenesis protein CpaD/CtpE
MRAPIGSQIKFMPFSSQGRWYNDPERAALAEVPHTVTAATITGAAWNAEDYDTLLATLQTHYFLRTAIAGANNDIDWIARQSGAAGSAVTVAYVVAGNNTPLSVGVAANALTINLATSAGGAATSTANDVIAAVQARGDALALVSPKLAAGNDGTGVLAALSATGLGAWTGTTPTLDAKLQTTVDGTNWYDVGTAFTQKTAPAAAEPRAFAPLAVQARWVFTVGGTTPLLAFSMAALDKRTDA